MKKRRTELEVRKVLKNSSARPRKPIESFPVSHTGAVMKLKRNKMNLQVF